MKDLRLARRYGIAAFLAHALFILVTLVPGWRDDPIVVGDVVTYLQPAMNVVEHGAFSRDTAAPFKWEPYRTPGYPLLIAASIGLTGDYKYVLFLAALTAGIAAFCAASLAGEWSGPFAAHAAGLIVTLLPNSLGLSSMMVTDAMAGHLTLVWFYLLHRGLVRRAVFSFIGAAMMLVTLQSMKPTFNAAVFLAALAPFLYLRWRSAAVAAAGLVLAGILLPLFLSARNYESHGIFKPTLLDVDAGRLYFQAQYVEQQTGRGFGHVVEDMDREDRNAAALWTAPASFEGRLYLVRRQQVASFLESHPVAAARIAAVEMGRQFLAPQEFAIVVFRKVPRTLRAVGSVLTIVLAALAAAGCLLLARSGRTAPVLLGLALVAFFLLTGSISHYVGARLRFPADMVLAPFAGTGVAGLMQRRGRGGLG